MRTSISLLKISVAVAVLSTAAYALAQDQGGGRRGGFGGRGGGFGNNPLMLLQAEPVQKELELSDDQKTSISKLGEDARQAFSGGNRPSREEMQQAREDQQKKINDILLPNQQDRLQQITLQLQGARALSDPKVADKLKLTDDQKKQLADLSGDYRQKMMDLFQGGGPPDRDAMNKLRTEQNDKAMAILTSDQKDEFTKMQGKKIDIDPALLFRGGRRNRGGGGDGGKGQPDA
jgi:Spy/CpxP family protein refolding chaperone